MVTIQLSNFNKTLKVIDLKKNSPNLQLKKKKTIPFKKKKINNTKSPFKGGNQKKINSKYKVEKKKPVNKINRELSGLAQNLSTRLLSFAGGRRGLRGVASSACDQE
jgi:hypothetical protein